MYINIMENKRVAILFYGLTRTLEKTLDSIKQNVFTPLDENGIHYDIFIHTYKIFGEYKNLWPYIPGKDNTHYYKNEDVEELLKPKHYIFDDQEIIKNGIDFNKYHNHLDNWTQISEELTKQLISNTIFSLYSQKRVVSMFDENKDNYDYVIIFRPDLQINNKLDVKYFEELNDNNIIVPNENWFRGFNPMFIIGKPNVISSYSGKLFDELQSVSEKQSIIPVEEYYMLKAIEKKIFLVPKNISLTIIRN